MSRRQFGFCCVSLSLVGSLAIAGCTASADDGEDDALGELDDAAKADSLGAPTQHGPIFFATSVSERLRSGAKFHAWSFALTGEAEVSFETFGLDAQASLDTVVYLYKRKGETSRWAMVDKNDDHDELATRYSRLRTALTAGEYRVIVKGKKRTTKGTFHLEAACAGEGCPTEPCLFGASRDGSMDWTPPSYLVEDKAASQELTPDNVDNRSLRAPIVRRAVALGTDNRIDSVEEAFRAVEGASIRERHFTDSAGASYWSLTFADSRTGDLHSVIFASAVDLEPLAYFTKPGFSDAFCKVRPPVCALGAYLGEFEESDTFSHEITQVDRDTLGTMLAKQIMAAAVEFASIEQPDEIFISADAVETWALRDLRTDAEYDLVRLIDSAGDDWGAVFAAGTTERVAVIRDGSFELCSRFVSAPR